MKALQGETGDLGWMASRDLRDQRATLGTKARGVNQVEMEPGSQAHQAPLDHRDKSSTLHLETLTESSAVSGLRVDLVYLARLDSLVPSDQRGTQATQELPASG